jgi:hypothetical protein
MELVWECVDWITFGSEWGTRSTEMQNSLPEQLFSLSRSIQLQGAVYPAGQLVGYCLLILKV